MQLQQTGRSRREHFEVTLLSWPAVVALAGAVPIFGVLTGSTSGWRRIVFGCLLFVAAGLSALAAWLRGTKTGGYKRAAARYARLVAGAGQPVVIALGELTATPPGAGSVDLKLVSLRDQIISTVRGQCGTTMAEETRAATYEFRGTRDLHRTSWAGRRSAPRDAFLESDVPYGRNVVEFAASTVGDIDRVDDVLEGKGPGPRGSIDRPSYRSYLSAAVSAGGKSWGMLTVDSPEVAAFRETDEGTIALLAGVLAAGLAHAGVLPQAAKEQ